MSPRDIIPSEYDLIVVGTGLQESLLAAGAAKAGKKVLHLDTADFYGSHWASHQLGYFQKWCKMHASGTGPLYSNAEMYKGSEADLGPSNEYNIDLAPKLVYSTGRLIEALLGGAAQNYLEFKLLQQSYVWREGQYWQVPASRADVFRDSTLKPPEKRLLMRFLQKLQQHAMASQEEQKEVHDRPFIEVLRDEQLTQQLQGIILYALAFANSAQSAPTNSQPAAAQISYQQSGPHLKSLTASSTAESDQQAHTAHEGSRSRAAGHADSSAGNSASQSTADVTGQSIHSRGLMRHSEGMDVLAQYMRSAGRYGTGTGAFLLPVYGAGELPQAFCRVAAVAGALYVLRQGIGSFLIDPESSLCHGLLTCSGQELKASAFAGNPETLSQFCRTEEKNAPQRGLSRAVMILDAPLVEGKSQVLVVLPPGHAGSSHPVRALQLGEATACAPKNRYIVHLSTLQTAATAREDLQEAAEALADLSSLQTNSSGAAEPPNHHSQHTDTKAEPHAAVSSRAEEDGAEAASQASSKPRALFLAYYNQAIQDDLSCGWDLPHNVALCKMPSPSVAYEDCVQEAEVILQRLCPDLESLLASKGPALDDHSDDEAIEALSEALDTLGRGEAT